MPRHQKMNSAESRRPERVLPPRPWAARGSLNTVPFGRPLAPGGCAQGIYRSVFAAGGQPAVIWCHLDRRHPGMPTRPVTVEGATRPRGRRGRSWRGRAASPALPGSQGRRAVGRGEHRRPQAARHRRPRCAPGSSAGGGDGEGRAHCRGRRVPGHLPQGVACRLAQRPVAGRRRPGGGRLPRCPPAAGKPVQMACGSWIVQHHETIAGNRIPDEGWPWGFRPI